MHLPTRSLNPVSNWKGVLGFAVYRDPRSHVTLAISTKTKLCICDLDKDRQFHVQKVCSVTRLNWQEIPVSERWNRIWWIDRSHVLLEQSSGLTIMDLGTLSKKEVFWFGRLSLASTLGGIYIQPAVCVTGDFILISKESELQHVFSHNQRTDNILSKEWDAIKKTVYRVDFCARGHW